MSGNGRGNMRPTSRSPPFLVIGLLVALCILAFNYWNLWGKNSELSNQHGDLSAKYEALQLDFRAVSDKHLSVQKRTSDLAVQLSELQEKVKQGESTALEKTNQVRSLSDEKDSLNKQLAETQGQLKTANQDLEKVREEKKLLDVELNKVKGELQQKLSAPVVCDKKACKDSIREVVGLLTSSMSKADVSAALKPNQEIMALSEDLLQGADTVVKQQAHGGEQQIPGGQPEVGQQQPQQQHQMM